MAQSVVPFNLVVGEGQIYMAPVGESFPAIDLATPAGNWVDLGKTEGPVTITHVRAQNPIRTNQSAMLQKEVLVTADETIAFSLAETDLDSYGDILQDVTATDTAAGAGTAGYKTIAISPSYSPQFALLVRTKSAIADGFRQYEYHRGSFAADHAVAYTRGDKAVIPCEFNAMESTSVPGTYGDIVDFAATAL